jgi:hypothetical protein
MVELSERTRRHIEALFRPGDFEEAEALLVSGCGENLPLLGETATPVRLERVRFAAIRVSGGDLGRLREAVMEGARDWRDLLVAAGFADAPWAHEAWEPRTLDSRTVDRWMGGELPFDVRFGLNDSVEIIGGPQRGHHGAIIGIVTLEPEPRYLVELGTGEDVEQEQQLLRKTG